MSQRPVPKATPRPRSPQPRYEHKIQGSELRADISGRKAADVSVGTLTFLAAACLLNLVIIVLMADTQPAAQGRKKDHMRESC